MLVEVLASCGRNASGQRALEVGRLLMPFGARIERVDPASDAARWCVARYFEELTRRFEEGFDPGKSIEVAPFNNDPYAHHWFEKRLS